MGFFETFNDPPREFSLFPFWFLNDDLKDDELRRQLDDFAAHGVYGVVPHARVGLPESLGWMSDRWLECLKVIVDHCAENGMKVILYDEGMYPSGSCAGRVPAANPRHASRCIERRKRGGKLEADEELVAEIGEFAYVHTRSLGTIRGVHYTEKGGENAPLAGDILNPEAVASFLRLTHDALFQKLGGHFGTVILGIFTDEPNMLGKGPRKGVYPWTWGLETFLQEHLGYDFRPLLPTLWDATAPDSEGQKTAFLHALHARLDQVFYAPYSQWCIAHQVALTGHPAGAMDIGALRFFQVPGQDVVWRYLEPFKDKSLEGEQSTMGKCSASAQVHYGRSRNLNECFGAFGWEFSYEEMRWLTNWLLVRGVNLLSPHAFYYSVRGPRRNERPPDVGPNNRWWPQYKVYADYCRRLCWLLAQGRQVCSVAVLGTNIQLPWRAARVLYENQRDFNYLDTVTLLERSAVTGERVSVLDMAYTAVVIDGPDAATPEALKALQPMIEAGRVIAYGEPVAGIQSHAADAPALLQWLEQQAPCDVRALTPSPGLRYHHRHTNDGDFYLFCNEGPTPIDTEIEVAAQGTLRFWFPESAATSPVTGRPRLQLAPYTARVLQVEAGVRG